MNLLESVVNILETRILLNSPMINESLCDPRCNSTMHFCSIECSLNNSIKQRIKFILSLLVSTNAKNGRMENHISEFIMINDNRDKTYERGHVTIQCKSDNCDTMNKNGLTKLKVEGQRSLINQFNIEAASCMAGTLISRARVWAWTPSQAAQRTGTVGSIVVKL